jgi:hypothetical protein
MLPHQILEQEREFAEKITTKYPIPEGWAKVSK